MNLICNVHGISEHRNRKVKNKKDHLEQERWICKKCEYITSRTYISNLKEKAIKYGGGECHHCGYDRCWRALHFHHLDPSIKDYNIFESNQGRKIVRKWNDLKKEIDKCLLLCANCHTEVHDKDEKISLDKTNKYNISRLDLYLLNKSILQGRETCENALININTNRA